MNAHEEGRPPPGVPLRSGRERLVQTLAFEAGGLLLVAPLYAVASGSGQGESFALIAALSAAVMACRPSSTPPSTSPERRLAGRVASERPERWRLVHAVLHEATAVIVTWP